MDSPEKQFSLDRFYARYLCGNGALTDYRKVSRIQIAMANCDIGFYEPNAVNLSYAINHFIDGMNQFQKFGFNKESICRVNCKLRNAEYEVGYRSVDVWIGKSKEKAKHNPPTHRELEDLMSSWFQVVNQDNLSISETFEVYAKYLLTHPFLDGNGRTGRALIMALLIKHEHSVFPPDLYRLIVNKPSLFINQIQSYKSSEEIDRDAAFIYQWLTWEESYRSNVEESIRSTMKEIEGLLSLCSLSSLQIDILNLLWDQAVISVSYIKKKLNVSEVDISETIGLLITRKILEQKRAKNIPSLIFVSRPIIRLWNEPDELLFINKKEKKWNSGK